MALFGSEAIGPADANFVLIAVASFAFVGAIGALLLDTVVDAAAPEFEFEMGFASAARAVDGAEFDVAAVDCA
jgi:hypothetical protein